MSPKVLDPKARIKSRLAVAAMALMFGSPTSALGEQLQVETYASPGNQGASATTVSGPLTRSTTSTAFGSTASAAALANYGVHKLSAEVSSAAFNDVASATSTWYDTLHVTTPGASAGIVTVAIDLHAFLTADPAALRGPTSANATFGYQFTAISNLTSSSYVMLASILDPGRPGQFSSVGPPAIGREVLDDHAGVVDRWVTLALPFSNGVINLTSTARCHAQAIGDGNRVPDIGTARCDAGNSVYWGGVLSVTDMNGQPLEGWTVASDSGTDYRRSFAPSGGVPEPATWLSMIMGFGGLGGMIRRRRGPGEGAGSRSGQGCPTMRAR